jgi:predicted  nucleic acid-binding Zn-ribbon protein
VDIAQRLRALSAEIATLQTEIGILEEQIAFQTEIADDARIRALVSETPIADRDAQVASGDLARIMRSRADALKRLEQLRADQDGLLERMLNERGKR